MSIDKVRAFFRSQGMESHILDFAESSTMVELAAHAVGCEPARIAKSCPSSHSDTRNGYESRRDCLEVHPYGEPLVNVIPLLNRKKGTCE